MLGKRNLTTEGSRYPWKRRKTSAKTTSSTNDVFEDSALTVAINNVAIDDSNRQKLNKNYLQLSKAMKEFTNDPNINNVVRKSLLEWKNLLIIKAKTIVLQSNAKHSKNELEIVKWDQYLNLIESKLNFSQKSLNQMLRSIDNQKSLAKNSNKKQEKTSQNKEKDVQSAKLMNQVNKKLQNTKTKKSNINDRIKEDSRLNSSDTTGQPLEKQQKLQKTEKSCKSLKRGNVNISKRNLSNNNMVGSSKNRLHDPNLPHYAKETISNIKEWYDFFDDTFDKTKGTLKGNI